MSFLPPPPSFEEVMKLMPADFKPGYPDTDRLASALDAWKSSKALAHEKSAQVEVLLNELEAALGWIERLMEKTSDPSLTSDAQKWLEHFNSPESS